jgi:hypothetical protein
VADDQELGVLAGVVEQVEEAVQVDVVEGRLDLVEDVEGAGPGPEDGEVEGQGDQAALAPESSDRRRTFLPGGRASISTPLVRMSSGSVRTRRPSPPGNSSPKVRWNSRATSSNAWPNTSRTRSSTALTTLSRSRRLSLRSWSWLDRKL